MKNREVIITVVILLLCCCCLLFGVVGWQYGDAAIQWLKSSGAVF